MIKKIASWALAFLALNALQASYGQLELLYFKPTIDQPYYAISGQNFSEGQHYPFGTRFNNDPCFQPAFRLQGIYDLCEACHALDLRFAYFQTSHSNSINGDALFDVIGFPGHGAMSPENTVYTGRAKYNERFTYYGTDVTIDRLTLNCCPENFFFFWGLHFNYIRLQERTTSDGTSESSGAEIVHNRFRRNSKFWGVGPQFGIDYRYLLPCLKLCGNGFYLGTNARAALLASNTWADLHYFSGNTGPTGVNLENRNLLRVTPAADIKIGLSFDCPCKCWKMHYELGYELIWVHRCIDAITGTTASYAGMTFDLFNSLNLQGPYFAFGLCF